MNLKQNMFFNFTIVLFLFFFTLIIFILLFFNYKNFINNINKNYNYFIQGNAINIPISDNSFKNILCLESAFHYQPRYVFFKECFRILEKNSELIIADIVLHLLTFKMPNLVN